MSKRCLLVFTRASADAGTTDPTALAGLLERPELEVAWAYLDDFIFSLETGSEPTAYDTRNQADIQAYDVVYVRSWAGQDAHAISLARICKQLGVACVDSELLAIGSRNKLSQHVMLHEAGLPIPKTLMGRPDLVQQHYKRYGFELPFIMKDKGGTRGQTNFLVRTEAELENICQQHSRKTFIAQTFIPNDGDYRVLVVGGVAQMAIHRTAAGDTHLNNVSQGGDAEIVPVTVLPPAVLAMSERAAQLFHRDVAGVDVVQSKADGSYAIFEVNRAPQIEHASYEHEKAAVLADLLLNL